MVMRCEKGFVSAGFEGDGIVNPFDAGCGWAVDMDKGDFIGRRSLVRDRNTGCGRTWWGCCPRIRRSFPPTARPSSRPALRPIRPVIGYVSQACHSPNVGRAIALAVLDPFDAGCGWAVDMDKGDFIGRRSLVRDRNTGGVRPNVVGLLPEDPSFVPPDGTPLVPAGAPADSPPVIGYVSQACHSPNVGRAIALAVLDDGRQRIDERIEIAAIDRRAPALVARPCFVDPAGGRMRG